MPASFAARIFSGTGRSPPAYAGETKALAPKPPAHPFCRCVLSPRIDILPVTKWRENPAAHRVWLRQQGISEGAKVVGSRAKLAVALTQVPIEEVVNIHRPRPHWVRRLWGPAILGSMQGEAFKIARSGGKHHGWYLNQLDRSNVEISNGIRSFQCQIDRHSGWILEPESKVTGFRDLRPEHQAALLAGWRQDMGRHEDCIDILRGILKERNNGRTA